MHLRSKPFRLPVMERWRLQAIGGTKLLGKSDVPGLWKAVPGLGLLFCVLTIIGQVILWTTGIGGN